jgi:sirohydrochlorin ferrochelatase
VLGWEIRRITPQFVLLGADSRIGMPGELLFKRQRHTMLSATFVQHDNDAARAVGVEPVHVSLVRRHLEQASRRCSP